MKTLQEILKQEPVYLNDWKCKIDLIGSFEDIYLTGEEYNAETPPYSNAESWKKLKAEMDVAIKEWENINILFASYGYESYSGDAFVLVEIDGKLNEVNGGHCSCYRLEGQWEPEETTLEALQHRLINGRLGRKDYAGNEFHEELKVFLGVS
jgi:hypothetical protein